MVCDHTMAFEVHAMSHHSRHQTDYTSWLQAICGRMIYLGSVELLLEAPVAPERILLANLTHESRRTCNRKTDNTFSYSASTNPIESNSQTSANRRRWEASVKLGSSFGCKVKPSLYLDAQLRVSTPTLRRRVCSNAR